jgi:phosphomethylpyrimidine synthase
MKITEDSAPQSWTAKQGIAEEEAPGMEAKPKEFVEKGAEVYAKV